MIDACTIRPSIRDKKGKIVDSKLYPGLLSLTGYNIPLTGEIYMAAQNPKFKEIYPFIKENELGEIDLDSYLESTDVLNYIYDKSNDKQKESIVKNQAKKLGILGSNNEILLYKDTKENQILVDNIIKDFNKNPMSRVMDLIPIKNINGELTFDMHFKSDKEMQTVKQNNVDSTKENIINNADKELYQKLITLCKEMGLSIGALNEIDKRMGVNGVADFSNVHNIIDGLIQCIRIADGDAGIRALPEEFSHLIVRALLDNDNAIAKRLISTIETTSSTKEILGDEYDYYAQLYNNDGKKLAEEAAGKLVTKYLRENIIDSKKPYSSIFRRFIEAFKEFFRKLNISKLFDLKSSYRNDAYEISKMILNGKVKNEIDLKKIKESKDALYQVNALSDKFEKMVKKSISIYKKELYLYRHDSGKSNFSKATRDKIKYLEECISKQEYFDAINSIVKTSSTQLGTLLDRLHNLSEHPQNYNIRDAATLLLNIKSLTDANERLLGLYLDDLNAFDGEKDIYNDEIKALLINANNIIRTIRSNYISLAKTWVKPFLETFMGPEIAITMGKDKGKTIKFEEEFEKSIDISFIDRFLCSMSTSSDYMLKIFDQAMKQKHNEGRLNYLEQEKQIIKLGEIYRRETGGADFNWLFERDADGHLTGNYISEYNWVKYKEDKENKRKELLQIYGVYNKDTGEYEIPPVTAGEDPIITKNRNLFYTEYRSFKSNRLKTVTIGNYEYKVLDTDLHPEYKNNSVENLNSSQKKFYDAFMALKKEMDMYMPSYSTKFSSAIKIEKDLIERVKHGEGSLGDLIQAQFLRTSNDVEFGNRVTITDFNNREVQHLPIFYTRMQKGRNMDNLSLDPIATLCAYSKMANNYKAMDEIVNIMEVARDLMEQRKIIQSKGGKIVNSLGIKKLDQQVISEETDENENLQAVINTMQSNFMGKLRDMYSIHLYGQKTKDEGTFGDTNIDKAKSAGALMGLTSFGTLAFNTLASVANVLTGNHQMLMELKAQQFFNLNDLTAADTLYAKEIIPLLSQLGERVQDSKLHLWIEMFDVLQDFSKSSTEVSYYKNKFQKLVNSSLFYCLNNAGEHFMQTRTSLALAQNVFLKDKSGNKVKLWDALEVVYLQENGSYGKTNQGLGAKLQVREGLTKMNGEAFTTDDINRFKNKTNKLNVRMHGAYSVEEMSAFQMRSIGRLMFMYRKHVIPSLERRFGKADYDMDLELFTEGYYNTVWRTVMQIKKEMKEQQSLMAAYELVKNSLSEYEKQNIKRAIREIVVFNLLTAAIAILNALDFNGDDDEDGNKSALLKWYRYRLMLILRREKLEIGAFTPSLEIFSENLKMLNSPMVGINTIESTIGILDALWIPNWFDEIESGKYKGLSKGGAAIVKSPVGSIYRQYLNITHPEEQIKYYNK